MNVTITSAGTMTSPLCRSVFSSVYQYTMKCVLRTAVITSSISRYFSVKCSFSKPFFKMPFPVTYCEHRMKLLSIHYFEYSPKYFIFPNAMFNYT